MFRKICIFVGWIQSLVVLGVNFYWYWLIVKKLIRIIKGTDNQNPQNAGDDEYKNSEDATQADSNGEKK